jgi:Derlin-2/3
MSQMFELPVEGGNSIPPVTAAYTIALVATTVLCAAKLVSPMSLYFSAPLIMAGQFWRLITHFFFLGSSLSLDFVLHIAIFFRYSRDLEERCFLNRPVEFAWMLFFGGALLTVIAAFFRLMIMSTSLGFMITYVWARRHPDLPMAPLFGLFRFRAPYLPWVLLVFSFLSGSDIAADLTGLLVGHLYYYLEFVYPRMRRDRRRFIATPRWFYYLCLSAPPSEQERREADAARGFPLPPLPLPAAAAAVAAPAPARAGALPAPAPANTDAAVPAADPEVVRRNLEIAARRRRQLELLAEAQRLEDSGSGIAGVGADSADAAAAAGVGAAAAETATAAAGAGEDVDGDANVGSNVEPTPEELRRARLRARAAGLGSPSVNLYG